MDEPNPTLIISVSYADQDLQLTTSVGDQDPSEHIFFVTRKLLSALESELDDQLRYNTPSRSEDDRKQLDNAVRILRKIGRIAEFF